MPVETFEFDINVMNPKKSKLIVDFTYKTWEINRFLDYLYDFKNEQPVDSAIELLLATKKFRSATAQQKEYVKSRQSIENEEVFISIYESMANGLLAAQSNLKMLNESSIEHTLLQDAFIFSAKSVSHRLKQMQENKEKMFFSYQGSTLQKLLKQLELSPHPSI